MDDIVNDALAEEDSLWGWVQCCCICNSKMQPVRNLDERECWVVVDGHFGVDAQCWSPPH